MSLPTTACAKRGREIGRDLAGFVVLAGLLTVMLAGILDVRSPTTLAAIAAFNLLVSFAIGGIIHFAFTIVMPRLRLDRQALIWRLAVVALVVGGAVMSGVEIAFCVAEVFLPTVAAVFPRWGVVRVAVPVTIAMVVIGHERERVRRRAAEAELRGEQIRSQALRSEVGALQSRTNPHFLFNALNTIAALIAEDPKLAERAVERLALLLRYALQGTQRVWVRLGEEMAIVEQYLELERLRFGARLALDIAADDALADEPVPPMLLQPLVENAVRHGVAQQRNTTTVHVKVTRIDDRLAITVRDDGPGSSSHRGTGTALADLRRRIGLLYGDRARIEAAPAERGYRVHIELPLGTGCLS